METPEKAKAMRDDLRATAVAVIAVLAKYGVAQQHDMLRTLALNGSSKEWLSGRLSIYIDNAVDALHHIKWTLDRLEQAAAEEVQG